jgi:hypothetical protein
MALAETIFTTLPFFIIYEWAQWARMFDYTRLERFVSVKQSSFMAPLISYKENEKL